MSREQRKYRREELAKADSGQLTFSSDGAIQERKRILVSSSSIDVNKFVFCPFCLKYNKLQRFLVSGKKGISRSRAQCPECGVGMLLATLLREWDPVTYAEWVFGYRKSGFWQKIKFALWKEELAKMGWDKAFWDHYKTLKGAESPDDAESYGDYMNRQGEEAAAEWNREDGYA